MTDNQPSTAWRVVSQTEALEPDPSGRIVRGTKITYRMDNGNSGSVFVPDTMYKNADSVKALIQDSVNANVAIQNLSSEQ